MLLIERNAAVSPIFALLLFRLPYVWLYRLIGRFKTPKRLIFRRQG